MQIQKYQDFLHLRLQSDLSFYQRKYQQILSKRLTVQTQLKEMQKLEENKWRFEGSVQDSTRNLTLPVLKENVRTVVLKINEDILVEMERGEATGYLETRHKFIRKEEQRIKAQIGAIQQNIGFIKETLKQLEELQRED